MLLLLPRWALAGTLGHAIFLFLTASVIAFLLNLGVVRSAAAMIVLIVALVTVVVEQTRSAADRVDAYLTDEPGRSGDSAFDRDVAECPVGVMTGGAGRRCCAGLVPCGRKAERE